MAKAKSTSKTSRVIRGNLLKVPQVPNLPFANSYTSLLYGIISVFILFLIIVFGVRVIANRDKGQITKESPSIVNQEAVKKAEGYVVKKGDTLWSIAESQLGDGFRWGEIAKANNLKNDTVEVGMNLRLPEKNSKMVAQAPTVTPTIAPRVTATAQPTYKLEPTKTIDQNGGKSVPMPTTPVMTKIVGNTYTVVRGDNLWNISVRAYGTGFKWGEIAKANNLLNPRVIHAGNVLQIPR